jgi:hypothetical protein
MTRLAYSSDEPPRADDRVVPKLHEAVIEDSDSGKAFMRDGSGALIPYCVFL